MKTNSSEFLKIELVKCSPRSSSELCVQTRRLWLLVTKKNPTFFLP